MDIEKLASLVAERVVELLKNTDQRRIAVKKYAVPPTLDDLLRSLKLLEPININGYSVCITAITRDQLCRLLRHYQIPDMPSATLTAMLKSRGIVPFAPSDSTDPRRRYCIDGKQTQCYVFNERVATHQAILKAVHSLEPHLTDF